MSATTVIVDPVEPGVVSVYAIGHLGYQVGGLVDHVRDDPCGAWDLAAEFLQRTGGVDRGVTLTALRRAWVRRIAVDAVMGR